MSAARFHTVAHQKPGECEICDERHARITAAVAKELAEEIRAAADDLHQATPGVVQGLRYAADLIDLQAGSPDPSAGSPDPEVKR